MALAVVWVLTMIVVFASRIGFALELEWMEGGTLHQAWRLQRGQPIYGPPSPDFVPFLYTPLYPALIAGLGKVVPLGYPLARAISVLSVAATGAALWRLVRREGKPESHAAVAVGLFLAGYVFGFRWLDIARGDALFLALVTWGLALLRESDGDTKKAVLAGVLVSLAFWTKQTAAVFVLASGLAGLLVAPRQVWIYAGTIAAICGGGVLIGQQLTDGWLWVWIYETHQTHAFNDERFERKTWGMFVHSAPFLAAMAVALVSAELGKLWHWTAGMRQRLDARTSARERPMLVRVAVDLWDGLQIARGRLYWGIFAAAGLLVSALGYSTQFAEPNAFLPGITFGAAALAVALPDASLRPSRRVAVFEGLCLVAVSAQMVFALAVEPMYQPIQDRGLRAGLPDSYAWQDPGRTIPSAKQRADARALRDWIEARRETEGELLAIHRPWWSVLAGGPGHVGAMGINDVSPEARAELMQALRRGVADGRFDAVWVEGSVPRWLSGAVRGWTVGLRLWGEQRVRPMSGWMSEAGMVTPWRGEQLLLVRPQPREVPAGVEVVADFEHGRHGFEVVRGDAFGRTGAASFQRNFPPVGPHGGSRFLSSAKSRRRIRATGEVRSPVFELPAGGAVELLLGTTGTREGLAARLVAETDGSTLAELALPRTHFDLLPVRWSVPETLAGARVRLHVVDDNPDAAVFVDDVWVHPGR